MRKHHRPAGSQRQAHGSAVQGSDGVQRDHPGHVTHQPAIHAQRPTHRCAVPTRFRCYLVRADAVLCKGSGANLGVASRDSLQIASQSLTAPASVVMDELSAIVNIVTMSNIVTAQLLQQVNSTTPGAAGSASSLVVEPGTGLERCLCSRSPLGVRSCTCPDADATEQESARVWLEVARIVDGVSARRLPELVPKCVLILFAWWCAPLWSRLTPVYHHVPSLAAIPMTSCRIDVMLEVKTLAALASSTLSVPASKEAGNLVASVKLPADIANVPGLLNGTTANEATLRYRVVRWLDDPFQFASLGNPAAVASQVLSVDFLNNGRVALRDACRHPRS